jgi:hypothetical protein
MEISRPPNEELKDKDLEYKEELLEELELGNIVDVGDLNKQEANRIMRRYAVMSSVAYDYYDSGKNIAEAELKKFLPKHDIDHDLSDENSVVIKKGNEVIISYRGTRLTNLSDLNADAKILLGFNPLSGRANEAQRKYDMVKNKYPQASITTTGHSLGGNLGYYVAKNNDLQGHFFNLGSSLTDTASVNSKTKVNIYHTSGDLVGLSNSFFSNDNFTEVPRPKWASLLIDRLVKGGIIGGGLGIVGGGLYTQFYDIHGLHNFMPPEAFKGDLEPTDIGYRWLKPLITQPQFSHSTRGRLSTFEKPQKICLNPKDSKCKIKVFPH